jgi:RimJ/RimL family protein N-acetyltransferase
MALVDAAVQVNLRPVTMDDANMLFRWRNDPVTRANSRSTASVSWEDHCKWLKASLANPNRDLLVAEIDGVPVGRARIDRGEETEVSWTVSPDHRGKGVGKAMVAMVAAACPRGPVVARIKPSNRASQAIAAYAGFRKVEDGELQVWRRP